MAFQYDPSRPSLVPSGQDKKQYWDLLNQQAKKGQYTPASDRQVNLNLPKPVNTPSSGGLNPTLSVGSGPMKPTSSSATADSSRTTSSMPTGGNSMDMIRRSDTIRNTGSQNMNQNQSAPTSTPTQQAPMETRLEDTIQQRLNMMNDMIARKAEEAKAQAMRMSQMNQSSIKGNLGRLFGSNYDSSEATPIVNENNRLAQDLSGIDAAMMQSLQEENLNALNAYQKEFSEKRDFDLRKQQQDFDQKIGEGNLTGRFGGQDTMAMRKFLEDQANSERDRAFKEKGFLSDEDQRMFDNQMGIIDQILRTSDQKWGQDMDMRNYGIDYAKTYSGLNTDALNRAIAEAEMTGVFGGIPTVAEDQRMIDNALKMGEATGYYNGVPTFAREQYVGDDEYRWANMMQDSTGKSSAPAAPNFTKEGLTLMTKAADIERAWYAGPNGYKEMPKDLKDTVLKLRQESQKYLNGSTGPLVESPQADGLGAILQMLGLSPM